MVARVAKSNGRGRDDENEVVKETWNSKKFRRQAAGVSRAVCDFTSRDGNKLKSIDQLSTKRKVIGVVLL